MILLDTRTLIWALRDDARLGAAARDLIAASPARFVSAISHADLTLRSVSGAIGLPADFVDRVAAAGFEPLPFHDRHAAGLLAGPGPAGLDPFDLLLLAQATVDGLALVTADRALLDLDHTVDATR